MVSIIFSHAAAEIQTISRSAARVFAGVSLVLTETTLSHEPLEQRRLLAADVSLDGTVLTVAFDDASADSVNWYQLRQVMSQQVQTFPAVLGLSRS